MLTTRSKNLSMETKPFLQSRWIKFNIMSCINSAHLHILEETLYVNKCNSIPGYVLVQYIFWARLSMSSKIVKPASTMFHRFCAWRYMSSFGCPRSHNFLHQRQELEYYRLKYYSTPLCGSDTTNSLIHKTIMRVWYTN